MAKKERDDHRTGAKVQREKSISRRDFVAKGASAGITGAAAPVATDVHSQVARIKKATKLPVAVGFGVRTPEQARDISRGADGVVVGSALVNAIKASLGNKGQATNKTVPIVLELVKSLGQALRKR